MRKHAIAALLLAVALFLASCGGAGGGAQGGSGGDSMQGIDHGSGGRQGGESSGGMTGMDHGDMDHGSMGAEEMVMEDGRYSDRAFVDAMVPHHQGAVEMAEVALENAEHREIRSLAHDIVAAQEAEIEELRSIKEEEYGTSEIPSEMGQEEMGAMGMTDPSELAEQRPFDKAFIDAMISHHESAIDMANVALENTDYPEIREIAENIVEAQEREIAQMKRWREQWYPEG